MDFPKFRAQRAGDRPAADTATELKTVEDRFDDVLKNADKDRPLYLAALYVACYFYEARPGDFNLLVNLLLDKAAAEGDELSGVTTADWRDRSDTILRKLGIGIRRTSAGYEVLGFNAQEDISTARVFFEQRRPMFRERQLERLMTADLIFQDDLSLEGMEQAVRLLCDMMLADPNRRAGLMHTLLDRLVDHPEKWLEQSQGRLAAKCASLFNRATGAQNFFHELGQLFRPRRAAKETSIVMRVSYLFVTLERNPELQPLAWQLLDRLEESGHRALTCDLLLQAATDARFRPSEAFWRRLRHGLEGEPTSIVTDTPVSRTVHGATWAGRLRGAVGSAQVAARSQGKGGRSQSTGKSGPDVPARLQSVPTLADQPGQHRSMATFTSTAGRHGRRRGLQG